MLTIAELEQKTAPIFDKMMEHELKTECVPEPSIHWKRKLEALEAAELPKQRAAAIFDMRCEQAEMMGFQRMDSEDMVLALMGEPHTDTYENDKVDRQSHEWFYNHHTGVTLSGKDCNWGGQPSDFVKVKRTARLWFLPPFGKEEIWRCRFGKLDYLKRDIPYGVILRIQELKQLNLFNVFNIMAPLEAWERATDIDPIVVATIWELPPNKSDGTSSTAGQVAHFFLAQW